MNLAQLKELKEKLEDEKQKSKYEKQKYVIVIGDNGYEFKSSFKNYNDARSLEEYKKLENTDDFVKQIESAFEIITTESIKRGISFDKISMKTEVGCLCTPIFKEKLFMRLKYFKDFINGNWYEAIPVVENYDSLKVNDNVSGKYVPIVFSWTLGDIENENKRYNAIMFGKQTSYYELLNNKVPKKIFGIVDFDKFVYSMKKILGYNISMISCGKENVEISNFNDYLEQIINSSYSINYAGLLLSADFKSKENNEKFKILKKV